MTTSTLPALRPYVASDWENFLALDVETARHALRGASASARDRFAARWPDFLRTRYAWSDSGPTLDASLLLICELGGRFAGHLWLTEQTDFFSDERQLSVTTIAVAPEYRNMGIGGFLMDTARVEARKRGLTRISLGVDAPNSSAVALYERMGFQTTRLSMQLTL